MHLHSHHIEEIKECKCSHLFLFSVCVCVCVCVCVICISTKALNTTEINQFPKYVVFWHNICFVCKVHHYECLIKNLGIKDNSSNPTQYIHQGCILAKKCHLRLQWIFFQARSLRTHLICVGYQNSTKSIHVNYLAGSTNAPLARLTSNITSMKIFVVVPFLCFLKKFHNMMPLSQSNFQ